MKRFLFFSIIFFFCFSGLKAQESSQHSFPKALMCNFDYSYFSANEGLNFKTEKSGGFEAPLVFASIDIENGKAQFIGNLGAEEVLVTTGQNIVNFFEFTDAGNVTVTSVFVNGDFTNPLPATHSRHIGFLNGLLVSQFFGSCEPRN